MAIRVAQTIEKGIQPTDRRPGLRDALRFGEKGSDRFAPFFELMVNGNGLTNDVLARVTEVEYEDNEELHDVLKITLEGHFDDPITQKTVTICEWAQSDPTFSEGNIIWGLFGYGAYMRLIGGAEIVRREFSYGQVPKLTVVCYEPLHRMAGVFAEDAKTYKGMRASDIAKQIAQKKEYSGAIGALFNTEYIERLPTFSPKAEVQKRGESDYKFLKRMADVRGWHLFTRFDSAKKKFNLYFGPDVDKQASIFRYEYQPPKALLPEDTLLEFEPEIQTIDQNTEVEITAIDEKRKKKVEHPAKYVSLAEGANQVKRTLSGNNTQFKQQELKNGFQYRFRLFGLSKRIIATRPFKDEAEVKKFVVNWARENIKNFITGRGKVAGNEYLQSRQTIYCLGLGTTFSGSEAHPAKWYLTKVVHKITVGSGLVYETSFEARKVIDFIDDAPLSANPPAIKKDQDAKKNASKYVAIKKSTAAALTGNR